MPNTRNNVVGLVWNDNEVEKLRVTLDNKTLKYKKNFNWESFHSK